MNPSKLTIVNPPAQSALTLPKAKAYLRLENDYTDEDSVIYDMMRFAEERVAFITGRALARTTYRLQIDSFRNVELPKPPFIQVNAITYKDENGTDQTLSTDAYRIRDEQEPAWIEFLDDLPSIEDSVHPISIEYEAGYSPEEVPQSIIQYALMLVSDNYDKDRGTTTAQRLTASPLANAMLTPYIVSEL